MGRGSEKQTRRLVDQQLALQNQLIQQQQAEREQGRSLLLPQIQGLLTSQGYSPQEQSDITQQTLGGVRTALDAMRERAQNRLASTGATAGYPELLDELAREEGRDISSQTQQNQLAFAAEKQRRQLEGLQALGGLYGIDTNLLGRAMGVPPELLGVRAAASRGSSALGGIIGGIGAGLSSFFG